MVVRKYERERSDVVSPSLIVRGLGMLMYAISASFKAALFLLSHRLRLHGEMRRGTYCGRNPVVSNGLSRQYRCPSKP